MFVENLLLVGIDVFYSMEWNDAYSEVLSCAVLRIVQGLFGKFYVLLF